MRLGSLCTGIGGRTESPDVVIWSLAPLGILAVLVAIDWAAGRARHRPWIEPACQCLHPDPETRDPRFASRCRNCGLLWDVFSGQPLQPPRKDHS